MQSLAGTIMLHAQGQAVRAGSLAAGALSTAGSEPSHAQSCAGCRLKQAPGALEACQVANMFMSRYMARVGLWGAVGGSKN